MTRNRKQTLMKTSDTRTIGEIVAENYRTAPVFKKYGIDFCCKGGRTIEDACATKGIDPSPLLVELEVVSGTRENAQTDYTSWPLDRLVDHIEEKHHRYVEQAIQHIRPFLNKVVEVHGDHHPELIGIHELFNETAGNLAQHMKKEELILFPFIRKMVQAEADGTELGRPHFGTVENPIAMMKDEHVAEGSRFETIRKLSNDYTPPADACNTYRVTYALLKEFEEDLHLHIHLENNILFPKALEMEATQAIA